MKHCSIWYLLASEYFYRREILCISCSLQVFAGFCDCSTSERQWGGDSLGKPLFIPVMYSTNSSGNFLVLWASAWILSKIISQAQSNIPAQLSQASQDGTRCCSSKTFSCAVEIGWFSLIILLRDHRVMVAHRDGFRGIPGEGSMSEDLEPFHLLFAWKILSLNLILHCAYQMFQFHSSGSCGSNGTGGFFQFQPVCLSIAVVKLWNIPHSYY